jgi:hypothetical protein
MAYKPTRHVENFISPGRRLGRRPHDPDRPVLRLAPLLTGVIPDHPATADHFSLITASRWGMLGNDQYGDCGPAAVFHDRMLVSKYLAGVDLAADTNAVLDLYKRSGNPNFPRDDNGVVVADMLSEVAKNGISSGGKTVECVAYAQVNVQDLDEVHAAIAIFGSLTAGADLHAAQETQTSQGQPWDYVSNSPEWGGHAFLCGKYTSETTAGRPDLSAISWGMPVGITDKFWAQQVQEAWVIIWPEHLTNKSFLIGVDQNALAADYKDLTDRDLPTDPTPTPTPTPIPGPGITSAQQVANQQLAIAAKTFVSHSHWSQSDKTLAVRLQQWIQAWGL